MSQIGMLASDANNPEFQGAMNPDSLLHVRFYKRAVQNNFKTMKEERPVFDDMIFLEIHTPGNTLNIIDRPKKYEDERRFPMQWAHYMNMNSSDPLRQGTPLEQWPLLQPSQVAMLRAVQFFTVEQIAFASDEQIGKIGMIAGMAPLSFRDRAKGYLSVAKDASILQRQADENKALQEQMAKQATDFAAQMAEMRAMVVAVQQKPQRAPKAAKKTRAPMSEERKDALRKQLADARAKKAGITEQAQA